MAVKKSVWFGIAAAALLGPVAPAGAQTFQEALALAYNNNPQINIARSTGRATDENVSIAQEGNRPRISASGSYGAQDLQIGVVGSKVGYASNPASMSVTLVQPLFTGFQVENGVKQAEASVLAQREALRNTEQQVLYSAAQIFMEVIRDQALVALQESNTKFLSEQVRAAKDRFGVGEGTQTDVAQAEARYQLAVSQLNAARATLNASRATFRQIVGVEPKKLTGSVPVEKLFPKKIEAAVSAGQSEHPAIRSSVHNVDVAAFNVKVLEGQLLPQLSAQAGISRQWDQSPSAHSTNSASVGLNLTVPIYQGGSEYAKVRQAKEQLGTARIQVDLARDQVRQAVVAAWGSLQAAGASVAAARAQVEADQLALNGVVEEQRVGQRTTLDVLNAQTELVNARSNLVTAETNRVVLAFQLAQAIGRLDSGHLNLRVTRYDPTQHYNAVKDSWFGLRTPDGR